MNCLCSPIVSILIVLCTACLLTKVTRAFSVVRNATLQSCSTTTGLTSNFCTEHLEVTYTTEAGHNNTDVVKLMIESVEDTNSLEAQTIANKEITIKIRRTPIYFQYPTEYHDIYNYQVCISSDFFPQLLHSFCVCE